MPKNMLNVGFGNHVSVERVIAVVPTTSAPIKRLKDEAKSANQLIDATCGRKARAIVIMDSKHIVLSALHPDTLSSRFSKKMSE